MNFKIDLDHVFNSCYYDPMSTLVRKLNTSILKKSVAVVPIDVWEKMQTTLADLREDLEMYASVNYKKSIVKARRSTKSYSPSEARKKLAL